MNAAALLDACRAAGVVLQAEGDSLVVEADCDPPADLIDELREHKLELIAALSSRVVAGVIGDLDERAAIIEEGAGVPRRWAEGFAALCAMSTPIGFSSQRWQNIIDATGTFLDQWAAKAIQCGWNDLDVFGCDPDAPAHRFDAMGLVMLLHRATIIDIDAKGATIDVNGEPQRYRRRPPPRGTVSLWELTRPDKPPNAA